MTPSPKLVPLAAVSATLALAIAVSPAARAMCAMPMTTASIVTPLDAPIPRDGSLLVRVDVGYTSSGPEVARAPGNSFTLPTLELVRGAERIALVPQFLRAGLFRLEFATPPVEGEHELVGLTPAGLPIAIGGALPLAPEAPSATRARHEERTRSYQGPRGEESSTQWTTRVTLSRALPRHVAIVAMRPAGRPGAYQIFGGAGGRSALEDAGSIGGHCSEGFLTGRGRAWRRMRAELVAIDVFGRMSPASAPFTVE